MYCTQWTKAGASILVCGSLYVMLPYMSCFLICQGTLFVMILYMSCFPICHVSLYAIWQVRAASQGVTSHWVAEALYCLLDSGCLLSQPVLSTSVQEKRESGVQRIRALMRDWYKTTKAANPEDRNYTGTMNRLTLKMLGKVGAPCLRAKAAETRGLINFVLELLTTHQGENTV